MSELTTLQDTIESRAKTKLEEELNNFDEICKCITFGDLKKAIETIDEHQADNHKLIDCFKYNYPLAISIKKVLFAKYFKDYIKIETRTLFEKIDKIVDVKVSKKEA